MSAGEARGEREQMTRMVSVSREELIAERDALLARLDTTLDEFTHRAHAYALVGSEWEAWSRLQDIDFLLGNDPA